MGNRSTGALTVSLFGGDADAFSLSTTSMNGGIAVGGFRTFNVTPKTRLAPGAYSTNVLVTGDNNLWESFNIDFTVSAANLAGSVSIVGPNPPCVGDILSANTSGITNGVGDITYTWKAGTTVVGNQSTYQPTAADVGQTIT
jgi:hypothetical protein